MNLGRVETVDVDGLRRLAASIRAHFGDGQDESAGAGETGLAAGAGPMEVVDARPIGGTWLLDGLWRELGVATAIEKAVADRRFTTAVERVLFGLVANWALAPISTRTRAAADYLRALLVAHQLLPARDDALARAEQRLTARLATVDPPQHRRILTAYATWRVLRRLRRRAEHRRGPRTWTRHAETRVHVAIRFLGWLHDRGTTLTDLDQVSRVVLGGRGEAGRRRRGWACASCDLVVGFLLVRDDRVSTSEMATALP
ncbi:MULTISPECIES: hypothetical protein [unclassified Pseudofrankia]|uniref:hypothetical protein n=1 Tax=unclassified Pseudofrankia TaxID=2994372 RepID=UPI0008DA6597|nr:MULTISPECIES: hypothetical protein [unclassified Pseudofrankia]MDT3447007.1 hypothetical protein [Pseudofrankia sp. BMG5.37]OHV54572.1 hypothetical protein BCD48_44510 [Pseudofrankia sp. BMG5.36]